MRAGDLEALIVPATHADADDDHWYLNLDRHFGADGMISVYTALPAAGEPELSN
jgi:hypothetical protein